MEVIAKSANNEVKSCTLFAKVTLDNILLHFSINIYIINWTGYMVAYLNVWSLTEKNKVQGIENYYWRLKSDPRKGFVLLSSSKPFLN